MALPFHDPPVGFGGGGCTGACVFGGLRPLSTDEGLRLDQAQLGWGAQDPHGRASLAHVPAGPQDYCGQNSSLGSFSIITEKVPCGTTGVTCSKAIKIFIGVSAACPWARTVPWGPSDPASDGASPLGTADGAKAGGQTPHGDTA